MFKIGSSSYTALQAKVHVMFGRRLTQDDYRELLSKQSVSEIASYLKNETSYKGILASVNENTVHRGQLEQTVRKEFYMGYFRLFHYVSGMDSAFFSFIIRRNEIEQLLAFLRFFNSGNPGNYLFSLPMFLAEHSSFDLMKLAKVQTYADLLHLLRGTRYFHILNSVKPDGNGQIDLTLLEVKLMTHFYEALFLLINKSFSGSDRREVKAIFQTQIDLYNIYNLLRLKKNFMQSDPDIRQYVIPHVFKLKSRQYESMIKAETYEQAIEVLVSTPYGKVISRYHPAYLEEYAQEYRYELLKHTLRFTKSPAASVIAYLLLKKIEYQNIISIIEGVRYRLPAQEIIKFLVGISFS